MYHEKILTGFAIGAAIGLAGLCLLGIAIVSPVILLKRQLVKVSKNKNGL